VLSTTRPDGRPHATPISYVRRAAAFWLPTMAASVRERNVRANPTGVLVVTEGDHDTHVAVIVEGPVVVVAPDEAPTDVVGRVGDWASCWLRLDARRLLSYAAEGVPRQDPPTPS
jgi:pyridoxamine 5'-phosphate oxidase-like protein